MKLAIAGSGSLQNPAFRNGLLCFTRFRKRYNSGNSDIGIFDFKAQTTHFIALAGEANVSQPGSCWNERGLIFSSDGYGGPDRVCLWDGDIVHVLFKPKNFQTWEPSLGPDFYVAERHEASGEGPGQIIRATFADLDKIEELTEATRDCRQPCVSPDGRRVVFQEDVAVEDWRLILKDMASGQETELTAGTDATFSRDSKRLVFSNEEGRLEVMEIATGVRRAVDVETPYSGAPSFSGDDKHIAYEGGPSADDGGPPSAIYLTYAP